MGIWGQLGNELMKGLMASAGATLDPNTQEKMLVHTNRLAKVPLMSLSTEGKQYLDKLSDIEVQTLQAFLDYFAKKQRELYNDSDDWDEKDKYSEKEGKLLGLRNFVQTYRHQYRD